MSMIEMRAKERFKSLFFMENDDVKDIKSNECMVIAIDLTIKRFEDLLCDIAHWETAAKDLMEKLEELKTQKKYYEDINN